MEAIGILTVYMVDGSKQIVNLNKAITKDHRGQIIGRNRVEQTLVESARTIGGQNYLKHSVYLNY